MDIYSSILNINLENLSVLVPLWQKKYSHEDAKPLRNTMKFNAWTVLNINLENLSVFVPLWQKKYGHQEIRTPLKRICHYE